MTKTKFIKLGAYFDFGKLDKDADILSPIRNGEVRRGARWQDGKTARWRVVSCRFASLPFCRFAPLPPCHSHSQFCFYLPKSSYENLKYEIPLNQRGQGVVQIRNLGYNVCNQTFL
jgi:hypothetical protein